MEIITFCVLLLFAAFTESFPFSEEYLKQYPKGYETAQVNPYSNSAQIHGQQYKDLGTSISDPANAITLPINQYGFITRESSSHPQIFNNYVTGNVPTIQGQTVKQQQRSVINDPTGVVLNSVPKPYEAQSFPLVENINNVGPLRQAHYLQPPNLRNSPQRAWTEISAQSEISEQRQREAAIMASRAEIARATAQVNEKKAALAVNAQIAWPLNNPNTNTYNPPEQHPYANVQNNHQFGQLIQSNPKLRDVISSTRLTKRYLVIHPDGRVEHVDDLEPIVKKHPEHVLVNAGTLRNHGFEIAPPDSPAPLSPTSSSSTITPFRAVKVPANPIVPNPATTYQSDAHATKNDAHATIAAPTPMANLPEFPEPILISDAPANTLASTVPKLTTPPDSPAPLIPTSSSTNITPSRAVEVSANPIVPNPAISYQSDTHATKNDAHATIAAPTPMANLPEYPEPTPSSDAPATIPKLPMPSNSPTPILLTSTSSTGTSSPVIDVPQNLIPPNSATTSQSVSVSESKSSLPSTATSKTESSISTVNSESSTSTYSMNNQPVVDSSSTDSLCSTTVDEESPLDLLTQGPLEDLDNCTDIDQSDTQSAGKPLFWFRTTDLDALDELIGDGPSSVVYFINVQPQSCDTETSDTEPSETDGDEDDENTEDCVTDG